MIKCYCDSSYSPQHKLAVVGYQIGDEPINTFIIENTNNTSAEVQGLLHLVISLVSNNTRIEIKKRINLMNSIIDNNVDNNNSTYNLLNLINEIQRLLINNVYDHKNLQYFIYTDCESALYRINSKDEIINNGYKTKKGKDISNAEYYKKLFNILNNVNNIQFKHIKGHLPKDQMDDDNKKFSILDQFVRNQLRSIIKDDQ